MNKSQAIRDYVKAHPGCTAAEISNGVGVSQKFVSTVAVGEIYKGRFVRTQVSSTVANMPIYAYTWASSVTKAEQKRRNATHTAPKVKTPQENVSTSLDSMLDQIGLAIAQRLTSFVKSHVAQALTDILPHTAALPSPEEIAARAPQAAAAPTQKKSVLVVGLLPGQAGVLSTEFHDALDLAFWHDQNGDSFDRLKQLGRGADKVFVHTAHIGHRVSEALKSVGADVRNVTGGVTSMREALLNFYVAEAA